MVQRNSVIKTGLRVNAIKLLVWLLAMVAVALYYLLPPRSFTVAPWEYSYAAVYSDGNSGGPSEAIWINEAELDSLCKLRYSDERFNNCGMAFAWGGTGAEGLDFSPFKGMYLKLNYSGPADRIRLYLRNYDARYSTPEDAGSSKFASLLIGTDELDDIIYVDLDEFHVADWWIDQHKIPRSLNGLDLDNVVSLGFDYLSSGDHRLQIESIRLVGDWLSAENFLLGVIAVLSLILLWEGLERFFRLIRISKRKDQLLSDLVGKYSELEVQKQKFETLSTVDSLTGSLNRFGILRHVETIFGEALSDMQASIMLIDIDHFKRVNDKRGHDCGDEVLKQVASLIDANTRSDDVFGRWGGEEFVLLNKSADLDAAIALGEKLRRAVADHRFYTETKPLTVTISVGIATVTQGEGFEAVFKRADNALYAAKHAGRNCVFSERDLEAAGIKLS